MFKAKKMFSPQKMSVPDTPMLGRGTEDNLGVIHLHIPMPAPRPFSNTQYIHHEECQNIDGSRLRVRRCMLTGEIEQKIIRHDERRYEQEREYYQRMMTAIKPGTVAPISPWAASEVLQSQREFMCK